MPDKVGQQVGNYRLVKLLGSGGFADVYLGQHVQLASKQAAIKILHLTDIDAKKFQEEAETTEKLVHPHIVRLLDFDLQQETPFLVLDYAPNGSMRTQHPRGSKVPLSTVVGYLKEATSALQYAHDMHILHRDIKPDNMLIGRQGEILISDFGMAVLTQTGRTTLQNYGIGGTPFYMSPEQFRGKPEKASDQYALAIVVYEWLSGKVPFSEGNFIQLGYQHTHEPVPPLPSIPSVEAVIMKALAKEPKQRFESVQEFCTAFEQAATPTMFQSVASWTHQPGVGQQSQLYAATHTIEDRIQQCRDLINSLQSEPDEKEKAQKIRTVMTIVTSINANQLSSKPIALVAEQIQVLSAVVQEMIRLPSISPTASAADMQHWPISPLEMRQWTERLIALTGSTNFSSLDEATKSAVRDALGWFISFVGINARSNPDAEHLLLELYESITALSAPELQSCFLGIPKSTLFRRLGQRMQRSLSSASPSVSPDEVKLFGQLAAEGLSATEIPQPQQLKDRTKDALTILERAARLGETQPAYAAAASEALTALLEMRGQNRYLRQPDAVLRLRAVNDLTRTAWTSAVTHQRDVPDKVLSVIGDNMPDLLANEYHLSPQERLTAAWRYVQMLDAIAERNQNDTSRTEEEKQERKEEIKRLVRKFPRGQLSDIDPDTPVLSLLSSLLHRRLS